MEVCDGERFLEDKTSRETKQKLVTSLNCGQMRPIELVGMRFAEVCEES